MIKNIIFDIGNVLVTFQPKEYFLKFFQDEKRCDKICEEVFGDEAWLLYDQGIYEKEDLFRIYQEKYPQDAKAISYVLDHWLSLMRLKEDSYAYMCKMQKQGYHIYILSNISKDSADYLKKVMPFFQIVDGAVLSYEIKANKPDDKIFEALFANYQIQAGESIFFDDLAENIAAAKRWGVHGIVFDTLENAVSQAEKIIERERLC